MIPPPPRGKNIWGTVTLGDRGQLVIPKAAREHLGLAGGQRLIVLSEDGEGIALVPAEIFEEKMNAVAACSAVNAEELEDIHEKDLH